MKKIIIFVLVIVGLLFLLINIIDFKVTSLDEYYSEHYALGWTDFDVRCIVIDKFIDTLNHNNPTVVAQDSVEADKIYKFYFQTNDLDFYNFINKGDIVHSEKYSQFAKVFRNDSLIEFSLN